jgi:hypothetical protein
MGKRRSLLVSGPAGSHPGRFLTKSAKEIERRCTSKAERWSRLTNPETLSSWLIPKCGQFALANGGEDFVPARALGTDLMRVIPDPLRDFFSEAFQRCRQYHLTFNIDYECSSAQLYRLMHEYSSIEAFRRAGVR